MWDRTRLSPKSAILTLQRSSSRILGDLRSRCISGGERVCRYDMPRATDTATATRAGPGRGAGGGQAIQAPLGGKLNERNGLGRRTACGHHIHRHHTHHLPERCILGSSGRSPPRRSSLNRLPRCMNSATIARCGWEHQPMNNTMLGCRTDSSICVGGRRACGREGGRPTCQRQKLAPHPGRRRTASPC